MKNKHLINQFLLLTIMLFVFSQYISNKIHVHANIYAECTLEEVRNACTAAGYPSDEIVCDPMMGIDIPPRPTNFTATCQNGQISFDWDDMPDYTDYLWRLENLSYMSDPADPVPPEYYFEDNTVNQSSYTYPNTEVPGLVRPGEQYRAWIHTYNDDPAIPWEMRFSPASEEFFVCPLPEPQNVYVACNGREIDITWDAPDLVEDFIIRIFQEIVPGMLPLVHTAETSDTSYMYSSVEENMSYRVQIASVADYIVDYPNESIRVSQNVTCGNFVPTPTPTVIPKPWIQFDTHSFRGGEIRNMEIPENPLPFDRTVSTPLDRAYLVNTDDDNASGIVTYQSTTGSNLINEQDANDQRVAGNGWFQSVADYPKRNIDIRTFIDYAKSRKELKEITDINSPDSDPGDNNIVLVTSPVEGGGTVFLNQSTTVAVNYLNNLNKPTVILIDGPLDINVNINALSQPNPLAIIVNGQLSFGPDVTVANAIFIAESVLINSPSGIAARDGLQINGNLIVENQLINNRSRDNGRRAGVLVTKDINMYLAITSSESLLPFLSVSNFEWKSIR